MKIIFFTKLRWKSYTRLIKKFLFQFQLIQILTDNSLGRSTLKNATKSLEIVIVEDLKLCFLLTPKVGSRSIIKFFEKNSKSFTIYGDQATLKSLKYSYDFRIYSCLRDPISRAISCYKQKFINPDPRIKAMHKALGLDTSKAITFSEFCDFLLSNNGRDQVADKHWKSQKALISFDGTLDLRIFEDLIMADEIDERLPQLVDKLNHKNMNVERVLQTKDLQVLPTIEDRNKLETRYQIDYEIINNLKKWRIQ